MNFTKEFVQDDFLNLVSNILSFSTFLKELNKKIDGMID